MAAVIGNETPVRPMFDTCQKCQKGRTDGQTFVTCKTCYSAYYCAEKCFIADWRDQMSRHYLCCKKTDDIRIENLKKALCADRNRALLLDSTLKHDVINADRGKLNELLEKRAQAEREYIASINVYVSKNATLDEQARGLAAATQRYQNAGIAYTICDTMCMQYLATDEFRLRIAARKPGDFGLDAAGNVDMDKMTFQTELQSAIRDHKLVYDRQKESDLRTAITQKDKDKILDEFRKTLADLEMTEGLLMENINKIYEFAGENQENLDAYVEELASVIPATVPNVDNDDDEFAPSSTKNDATGRPTHGGMDTNSTTTMASKSIPGFIQMNERFFYSHGHVPSRAETQRNISRRDPLPPPPDSAKKAPTIPRDPLPPPPPPNPDSGTRDTNVRNRSNMLIGNPPVDVPTNPGERFVFDHTPQHITNVIQAPAKTRGAQFVEGIQNFVTILMGGDVHDNSWTPTVLKGAASILTTVYTILRVHHARRKNWKLGTAIVDKILEVIKRSPTDLAKFTEYAIDNGTTLLKKIDYTVFNIPALVCNSSKFRDYFVDPAGEAYINGFVNNTFTSEHVTIDRGRILIMDYARSATGNIATFTPEYFLNGRSHFCYQTQEQANDYNNMIEAGIFMGNVENTTDLREIRQMDHELGIIDSFEFSNGLGNILLDAWVHLIASSIWNKIMRSDKAGQIALISATIDAQARILELDPDLKDEFPHPGDIKKHIDSINWKDYNEMGKKDGERNMTKEDYRRTKKIVDAFTRAGVENVAARDANRSLVDNVSLGGYHGLVMTVLDVANICYCILGRTTPITAQKRVKALISGNTVARIIAYVGVGTLLLGTVVQLGTLYLRYGGIPTPAVFQQTHFGNLIVTRTTLSVASMMLRRLSYEGSENSMFQWIASKVAFGAVARFFGTHETLTARVVDITGRTLLNSYMSTSAENMSLSTNLMINVLTPSILLVGTQLMPWSLSIWIDPKNTLTFMAIGWAGYNIVSAFMSGQWREQLTFMVPTLIDIGVQIAWQPTGAVAHVREVVRTSKKPDSLLTKVWHKVRHPFSQQHITFATRPTSVTTIENRKSLVLRLHNPTLDDDFNELNAWNKTFLTLGKRLCNELSNNPGVCSASWSMSAETFENAYYALEKVVDNACECVREILLSSDARKSRAQLANLVVMIAEKAAALVSLAAVSVHGHASMPETLDDITTHELFASLVDEDEEEQPVHFDGIFDDIRDWFKKKRVHRNADRALREGRYPTDKDERRMVLINSTLNALEIRARLLVDAGNVHVGLIDATVNDYEVAFGKQGNTSSSVKTLQNLDIENMAKTLVGELSPNVKSDLYTAFSVPDDNLLTFCIAALYKSHTAGVTTVIPSIDVTTQTEIFLGSMSKKARDDIFLKYYAAHIKADSDGDKLLQLFTPVFQHPDGLAYDENNISITNAKKLITAIGKTDPDILKHLETHLGTGQVLIQRMAIMLERNVKKQHDAPKLDPQAQAYATILINMDADQYQTLIDTFVKMEKEHDLLFPLIHKMRTWATNLRNNTTAPAQQLVQPSVFDQFLTIVKDYRQLGIVFTSILMAAMATLNYTDEIGATLSNVASTIPSVGVAIASMFTDTLGRETASFMTQILGSLKTALLPMAGMEILNVFISYVMRYTRIDNALDAVLTSLTSLVITTDGKRGGANANAAGVFAIRMKRIVMGVTLRHIVANWSNGSLPLFTLSAIPAIATVAEEITAWSVMGSDGYSHRTQSTQHNWLTTLGTKSPLVRTTARFIHNVNAAAPYFAPALAACGEDIAMASMSLASMAMAFGVMAAGGLTVHYLMSEENTRAVQLTSTITAVSSMALLMYRESFVEHLPSVVFAASMGNLGSYCPKITIALITTLGIARPAVVQLLESSSAPSQARIVHPSRQSPTTDGREILVHVGNDAILKNITNEPIVENTTTVANETFVDPVEETSSSSPFLIIYQPRSPTKIDTDRVFVNTITDDDIPLVHNDTILENSTIGTNDTILENSTIGDITTVDDTKLPENSTVVVTDATEIVKTIEVASQGWLDLFYEQINDHLDTFKDIPTAFSKTKKTKTD